jgi:hypothetical protein
LAEYLVGTASEKPIGLFGSATGQGNLIMTLQTSQAQSTRDHAIGLGSVDLSVIDRPRLERSKLADRFAEDSITLSLIHLDVALAVEAQNRNAGDGTSCFKVSAKRLARDPERYAGCTCCANI